MKQKEFKSVKQYLATLAIAICCSMSTTLFTACSNEDTPAPKEDQTDLVLNFGDIVIKPYLGFGSSLADAEKYLQAEYPDYINWETGDVERYDYADGTYYIKDYYNDEHLVGFYFNDPDCKDLDVSGYDFYSPIPQEAVMAELERHGFKNLGEVRFPDANTDLTYLFLSADGTLEVQVMIIYETEEYDAMWAICFQSFDELDLKYLVK